MSHLEDAVPLTEIETHVKACVYALEGAGKTTFGATAASQGLTYIIDTEKSTLSLSNPAAPSYQYRDRIRIKHTDNTDTVAEILSEMREAQLTGDNPFKVLVVDTASELQERRLTEQLRRNHAKDAARHPYIAAQSDYKERNEFMRRLMIMAKDLEMHSVILVHAREDQDQITGRRFLRPDLSDKLAASISRHVNVLGYLHGGLETEADNEGKEKEVFKNYLQLVQTDRVKAKTRIQDLPPVIENPTFDILVNALEKQRKAFAEGELANV